jgi:hypothetical protein
MISFNLSLEFGAEIHLRNEAFDTRTPVITDSRMAPHEWIRNEKGVLLKTDGVSHGDDHFFPGPVDIAWDLAGTVIEWKLSGEAEEYLLEVYRKQTGDNARARMLSYKVGYAAFRLAWCRMALPTTEGTKDEARLLVETGRYCNFLKLLLSDVTGGRAELTPAA